MKKIEIALFFIFLTYAAMFLAGVFRPAFLNQVLGAPIQAARLLAFRTEVRDEDHPPVYWNPVRDDGIGVVAYDAAKADNGLTLFSSGKGRDVYLIDMQGKRVHTWTVPYETIQPVLKGTLPIDRMAALSQNACESSSPDVLWLPKMVPLQDRPPNIGLNISALHLYPDGSLLVLYMEGGAAYMGGGLAKIDKDSGLLWKYDGMLTHHDLTVGSDGKIYVLGKIIDPDIPPASDENQVHSRVHDYVVILSPEGRELKRVSILNAFNKLLKENPHPQTPFEREKFSDDDPFHANTVELIPMEMDEKYPMVQAGNLLLSFRALNMLVILNPDTESLTWASYGPWHRQHSPRLLKDGSIVLFDNAGNIMNAATSRVLRIDLNTSGILWHYDGEPNRILDSETYSSVEPLPNGNILVTETMGGRIFEVTSEKDVVWDYRSVERAKGDFSAPDMAAALFAAHRYRVEDLPFLKR